MAHGESAAPVRVVGRRQALREIINIGNGLLPEIYLLKHGPRTVGLCTGKNEQDLRVDMTERSLLGVKEISPVRFQLSLQRGRIERHDETLSIGVSHDQHCGIRVPQIWSSGI